MVDRPPSLAQGAGQRWTVDGVRGSARLALPPMPAPMRTAATVLVLCTTASAYRWSLVGRDGKVLAVSRAEHCSGAAAYASIELDDGPVHLDFASDRGGRSLVAVVVTRAG